MTAVRVCSGPLARLPWEFSPGPSPPSRGHRLERLHGTVPPQRGCKHGGWSSGWRPTRSNSFPASAVESNASASIAELPVNMAVLADGNRQVGNTRTTCLETWEGNHLGYSAEGYTLPQGSPARAFTPLGGRIQVCS